MNFIWKPFDALKVIYGIIDEPVLPEGPPKKNENWKPVHHRYQQSLLTSIAKYQHSSTITKTIIEFRETPMNNRIVPPWLSLLRFRLF